MTALEPYEPSIDPALAALADAILIPPFPGTIAPLWLLRALGRLASARPLAKELKVVFVGTIVPAYVDLARALPVESQHFLGVVAVTATCQEHGGRQQKRMQRSSHGIGA